MRSVATDSAGVMFPPPFIYLAALLVGIFGGRLIPITFERSVWIIDIALAAFVLGLALIISAFTKFRSHGTNVSPVLPVTALVFDGPYRFTRNPMYLGLSLIYAAIALWTTSSLSLVLLAPVLLIIRYAVIAREERYLTNKFGDAYIAYTKRVRRWV